MLEPSPHDHWYDLIATLDFDALPSKEQTALLLQLHVKLALGFEFTTGGGCVVVGGGGVGEVVGGGVVTVPPEVFTRRSRFGEPVPSPVRVFAVASERMIELTSDGDADG